jgi:hypothetical protein
MIIELNKGYQTEIDDADWYRLLDFYAADGTHHRLRICDLGSWSIHTKGYARVQRKCYKISLHRLIIGAKPGEITDHIDQDKLNNRLSNLRIVTNRENKLNSNFIKGISRFRGVSQSPNHKKWRARITNEGKTVWLGTFDDEIEAAMAYNEAAIRLHGDFAQLNTFGEDD